MLCLFTIPATKPRRGTRASGKTSVSWREKMLWESSSWTISAMPTCLVSSMSPTEDRTCEMTEQEKTYKTFCNGTRNSSHFYNSGHYIKLDKYAEGLNFKTFERSFWEAAGWEGPFLKFLFEFGILCVVYMLNGIQMHCHSQRCPISETGGLRQSSFDVFHTGRKMNRSSHNEVRVPLLRMLSLGFRVFWTFLTSLHRNIMLHHEIWSQKNTAFRNARAESLLITNLMWLQSHMAYCLLPSCFRAGRVCMVSVCADMNQLLWLARCLSRFNWHECDMCGSYGRLTPQADSRLDWRWWSRLVSSPLQFGSELAFLCYGSPRPKSNYKLSVWNSSCECLSFSKGTPLILHVKIT